MRHAMKPSPTRRATQVLLLTCGVVLAMCPSATAGAQTLPSPVRIARAPSGDLLVSDYLQQSILVLRQADLAVRRAFRVAGRPVAIAWGRGRIFVGNESTGSVEVYNPAGMWLYDLGGAKGLVRQPMDIAVGNQRGLVFVVDGSDKLVKVFDVNGPLLYTMPAAGAGGVPLQNPTGIAIDADREEVLVSDFGDPGIGVPARVHILDYHGARLGEISGASGQRGYGFSRPQGLAVDGIGHVFVVDAMLGQVLVFDRTTGAGLKRLGTSGTGPGQLLLPLDLVLTGASRDVFVTSNLAARVEVFRHGGLVP